MSVAAKSQQTHDRDFFVWDHPDAPVQIRLAFTVIDTLSAEASADEGSAGILLGRRTDSSVLISDFLTVRDEPLSLWLAGAGQSIFGSPDDASQEVAPLGVYRTRGGERLSMSQQDIALMASFFPNPWNVFLLIGDPPPEQSPRAAFFFWDDGANPGEPASRDFPFASSELRQSGSAPGNQSAPPSQEIASGRREFVAHRRATPRWLRLAAAATLVTFVFLTAITLLGRRTSREQSQPPPDTSISRTAQPQVSLGFQAEARSTDLRLTWDTASTAVRKARIGLLTIVDGNLRREVALTPTQLETGSITYRPVTDRIEFRLDVFSEDGQRESQEALAILAQNHPAARSAGLPVQRSGAAGQPAAGAPQIRILPVPYVRRIEPSALPEPPAIGPTSTSDPAPLASSRQLAQQARPAPLPQTTVASEGQMGIVPLNQALNTPAAAADAVVPPRATRRVDPIVPANMRRLLTSDLEISVMVRVDESGNVVQAEPQGIQSGLARMFAMPALGAARAWKFEPARRGGRPVPADHILTFRFVTAR